MVPGLVKGMYVAWKKYGKLPWSELLQPSVELARDGFKVTKTVARFIKQYQQTIENEQFHRLR